MINATPLRIPLIVACVLAAAPALAQQPSAGQANAIREACRSDYMANCAGVPPGGEAALACLKQNAAKTSPKCQQALRAAAGGPGASAPSSAPPASMAQSGPTSWPHTVSGTGGTATIYEPQVISWPDRKTLNTRIAIGITPTGAASPTFGVIEVAFTTRAELADRTVILTEPRLTSAKFPSADPAQAARFEERIRGALATMGVKQVPLSTIVLSLLDQKEKPGEVAIDNSPPRIFFSQRPASLVVFDGEPVLVPITGTPLSFAVNTNWDVFSDSTTKTWYLLNNGGWLAAPDAKGPWMPAGKLPPSFSSLPSDRNFAAVKQQIPGRVFTVNTTPTIFVSTTPGAIIVTNGAPQYVPITGTALSYVANTDAALFRDSDGRLYYLVSGRWFSASSLDGPWTFATPNLPPDFKRIPANGPRGFVLVSVPGTPQAEEALIEATIPQQSTLNRANAKLEVVYAGAPQFAAIPGTTMQYAVNTSFNVIQTSDGFFSCYQGAWFTAGTPTGPWTLATVVPTVIYTIPPANPMYPCTYVRVYASTPETVTYGYTSGYTMSYVSAGVVVYGTGYYYPPYIYPAPIPIYYPYPYSYAGATYYNPTTGAWAQGGAIYGPYGGAAKAGYTYNPTTGAWAQGGAIYGPYGGAGSFSAYNPSTGSYAHGSAVWGPDGAAANASWYNANTGRSVTTQQNANAYGRWGSSTISTPTQTIHTQSQSGAAGSAGSFTSSSGAKGGAVSGAGGNTAGAVKTASGNVYAGADGNVYKKTDNGWEKYNNGSWNQVQQPTNPRTTQTSQSRPTTQSTSGAAGESRSAAESGGRSEGFSQLDQDHNARTMGSARQQQFESMRGGFQGRAGGGFAGRGGGGFRR
ncbi:MAG TPA: hypothetical protein VKG21_05215 [Casimicrobiaceae bacterium]|nr:hypothetical protein [Casimicrobiaceae bacterium]